MPQVYTPEDEARSISGGRGSGSAISSRSLSSSDSQGVSALAQASVRDYEEFRDSSGVLRQRNGKQTDGKFGIRIWNSAGVLQIDNTYA